MLQISLLLVRVNTFFFQTYIILVFIYIGGGGVGKSHLIRTISQWTEKILTKQTDPYEKVPYTPKVLLLAFTGSASSLIGNYELHLEF